MNFKYAILLTAVLPFFMMCKDSNGFEKSELGYQYKFISKSGDTTQVRDGDHIRLSVKYYNSKDSLLFNSNEVTDDFRMNVSNQDEDGLLQEAVKMLKIGDSAQFLIPAENFYRETAGIIVPDFIEENEELRFEIKVLKRFTEKELDEQYEQYLQIQEAKEKQLLSEYLSAEEITDPPTASGLYIISLEKGNGKKAEKGKKVSVHYEGKLINGEMFDSSIEKGEPLGFTLGENEVIPAWEEAVLHMRVGDKIKIVAPSYLAYGERGYPPYIPPYSTLIFEMKLVEVK